MAIGGGSSKDALLPRRVVVEEAELSTPEVGRRRAVWWETGTDYTCSGLGLVRALGHNPAHIYLGIPSAQTCVCSQ